MRRVLTFLGLLLGLLMFLVAPDVAQAQSWVSGPIVEQIESARPPPPNEWVEVPGTWLRVYGHPDRYEVLLRLARHGAEALPRLANELGVPVGDTVHIYVSSTNEQFRSIQPANAPLWADATAYPGMGAVFVRDPKIRIATDEPLEQVLDHELVHILLGRAFAPKVPPSWLQEGAAQILAKQVGQRTTYTLADAALTNGWLSLDSLANRFPRNPHRADLAYAESADFVRYLQAEYGEGSLPALVHSVQRGSTLRGAVRDITGKDLAVVEASWRDRWTPWVGISAGILGRFGELAFGAAGLLLVGAGIARRRNFRRRLAEMGEEEALVDALVEEMRARNAS